MSQLANRLIYVVDDEELLLRVAEMALIPEGYALKKFQNPAEALQEFQREPAKPSLLLTDYAMGDMDGLQLSAACKAAHPDLKVLVVSGTAGPEVVSLSPVKVDAFMPKPYALSELAQTVRTLLAG
jgi:CheY-like chemotaxis protein